MVTRRLLFPVRITGSIQRRTVSSRLAPPVDGQGQRETGSWEILETIGLETVSVIDTGVGPDGVSLFSVPQFDVSALLDFGGSPHLAAR